MEILLFERHRSRWRLSNKVHSHLIFQANVFIKGILLTYLYVFQFLLTYVDLITTINQDRFGIKNFKILASEYLGLVSLDDQVIKRNQSQRKYNFKTALKISLLE